MARTRYENGNFCKNLSNFLVDLQQINPQIKLVGFIFIKDMVWVLNYIKEKFPLEWLSIIGNNELDEFGETGIVLNIQ